MVGITKKLLCGEPFFVEIGHEFPAPLPAADRTALGGLAVAAIHHELEVSSAVIRRLELSPR